METSTCHTRLGYTTLLENVMMLNEIRFSPLFAVKNENITFPFTQNHRKKTLKSLNYDYESVNQCANLTTTAQWTKWIYVRILCTPKRNHSTLDRHLCTYWLTAVGWRGCKCLSEILKSCAIRRMRLYKNDAAVYKKSANNVRFRCRYVYPVTVTTICVTANEQWTASHMCMPRQRQAILSLALCASIVIHYERSQSDDNSMNWKHSLSLTHTHSHTRVTTSVDNQSHRDDLWILMISNLE